MKILHIIDSGGMYGAEVMLLNLVEEQITLGLKPVIASIGEKNIPEKPFETEAIQKGFQVKKFRIMPGPNIPGALDILNYARKQGFDLLHSHGYKGNILLGFIPKRFRKIPVISTLHGYTSTSGLTRMRVYEWLDLFSHRFIDQVVLVNKGMLSNPSLKNQKKIKYQTINNGIPIYPDNSKSLSRHDLEDFCRRGFTIGSIGRFSTEKGYRYLIEAFSILIKKGLNAYLVIIGEGYESGLLKEMVKTLKLSDRVLFPGYLINAGDYIHLFDVYAIPSLTEGLPITLLEAMRAKIPVIASSVGGIPDVLQNGSIGYLAPSRDPHALADRVSRVHDNYNDALVRANRAYSNLVDHYSSEAMAKKYLRLYNQTLFKNRKVTQQCCI
jgi:glycosyltransferase involved in cell wall biosynthesis